jgi:hypothetical protein
MKLSISLVLFLMVLNSAAGLHTARHRYSEACLAAPLEAEQAMAVLPV